MPFPTTEAHIQAAERELGVRLPREYRERLLTRNGGELSTSGEDWQVFPVFDTTNRKTATRSASHIVAENRRLRSWVGFPERAVAIGSDGSGNVLLFLPLDASGRLDPQVFVWDHETRKCIAAALRYED